MFPGPHPNEPGKVTRPEFTLAVDFGHVLAQITYGATPRERHPSAGPVRKAHLMPGAAETINQLHDVGVRIIVAANPDAMTAHSTASLTAWLDRWDLPIGQVCFPTDRHLLDADLWLEDDPTVLDLLAVHDRPNVIFDQPWNRHLTGPRVHGWDEVPGAVARARMRVLQGVAL